MIRLLLKLLLLLLLIRGISSVIVVLHICSPNMRSFGILGTRQSKFSIGSHLLVFCLVLIVWSLAACLSHAGVLNWGLLLQRGVLLLLLSLQLTSLHLLRKPRVHFLEALNSILEVLVLDQVLLGHSDYFLHVVHFAVLLCPLFVLRVLLHAHIVVPILMVLSVVAQAGCQLW